MSSLESHRMALIGESNAFQGFNTFIESFVRDAQHALERGDFNQVRTILSDLQANKSQIGQALLSGTPAANQLPKDLPPMQLNPSMMEPPRPPADTVFSGPRTAATAVPPKTKEAPTIRAGQSAEPAAKQ
jgi:hypothetical protein